MPIAASVTSSDILASMTALFVIGLAFAGLAALVHVYIFTLESLSWTKPHTWKIFGIASQADADTIKPMAYNQGFYNLFLTIGTVVGILLLGSSRPAGLALIFMGTGSMALAALVLLSTGRANARSAAIQGVLPLLGIVFLLVSLP
jgi:putative membrane protein